MAKSKALKQQEARVRNIRNGTHSYETILKCYTVMLTDASYNNLSKLADTFGWASRHFREVKITEEEFQPSGGWSSLGVCHYQTLKLVFDNVPPGCYNGPGYNKGWDDWFSQMHYMHMSTIEAIQWFLNRFSLEYDFVKPTPEWTEVLIERIRHLARYSKGPDTVNKFIERKN